MPEPIGNLSAIRGACAWPGCAREPSVCAQYRPSAHELLPRGLQWAPIARGGVLNLCEEHAHRLAAVLGRRPTLSLTRR